MRDGVERTQPQEEQDADLHDGEHDVDAPERFRGLGDARCELLLNRARRLGAQELHSADGQLRKNGDTEHDDAHSPNPLHQGTPQKHRPRKALDVGEDGRSRRSESGGGLEECIHGEDEPVLDHERQGAGEGRDEPRRAHEQESFAPAESELVTPVEVAFQEETESSRESGRHVEGPSGVFSVQLADHSRNDEGDRKREKQAAQEKENAAEIDARPPAADETLCFRHASSPSAKELFEGRKSFRQAEHERAIADLEREVAAGDVALFASNDGADNAVLRKPQLAERRFQNPRAIGNLKLDDLGIAAGHEVETQDLTAVHHPEDGSCRDEAGR